MKLFYYQDKEKPINYFETNEQIVIPDKYQEKAVRAFWVSTVKNIDLPILTDEKEYKNELKEIINNAIKYRINTIFFQVRPTNDAFYHSNLNPYSRYLTGKEGKKPPFDVLKYLIDLAKPHQIEIHAWCNPYRISMKLEDITKEEYLNSLDKINFARKRKDLVLRDENNQLIFNPTREEVKTFIIESMLEIVNNYDVKGIHWDDYFYPYYKLVEHEDDLKDFENREDKSLGLKDFRRMHVTDIIRRTHLAIKNLKRGLQFGVSPFGIWRSKYHDERGSNTSLSTSESYDGQYADTYLWIKEGYIDYIVPQLYWEFGHHVAPFGDLCKWWADIIRGTNVALYIGHASYRQGREGEFSNPFEVVNQLKFANNFKEVSGNVFFTYKNFKGIEVSKEAMENIRKTLNNEE